MVGDFTQVVSFGTRRAHDGLDAVSRAELAAYVKRNKQSQLIIVVSHDDEMVGAVEGVVDLGSMYQGK